MSEENKYDIEQELMFRSILEEGTEEVPAHIWDAVEADLDRIAHRRKVLLWFRRTAIGAASAAVLALGLLTDMNKDSDLVRENASDGMIAVVKQDETMPDATRQDELSETVQKAQKLIAMAPSSQNTYDAAGTVPDNVLISRQASQTDMTEDKDGQQAQDKASQKPQPGKKVTDKETYSGTFDGPWPEEEKKRLNKGTSFMLSGLTVTNNTQNKTRLNPMRRHGVSRPVSKTGVKQTSSNTSYGIPVSFGAGVRFDLSERWSLGTGLNYTLLTRKFFGTYTELNPEGKIVKDVSSDINESQHYIGIPLNAYFDIISNNWLNFYAYAGGSAEKCLADKFQITGWDITHTENVKGVQLSANIGMGAEFMLGKHLGFYLDPSFRYYFNCNQPRSIRTAQRAMFGMEAGFRFRL